ncbi:fimbria/pilus chaperone family protein [Pseudomonas putida]|uniref:fimbria/pilus chaperone family protein n=1 Tax=Pseudomonas putida TaxID=303 RepID=UPI0037CA0E6C
MKPFLFAAIGLASVFLLRPVPTLADGMVPETSVVIVHEADGETSIRVRNDDDRAALLLVTIQDIPEDDEPLVFLTQPAWRVEAGQEQVVRFILRDDVPLQGQRLKRVVFEGVPELSPGGDSVTKVGVTIRQNLPLLIHPRGLDLDRTPWTQLVWSLDAGQLRVTNPSLHVVRLAQDVVLLPSGKNVSLPRSYLLPGQSLLASSDHLARSDVQRVRIFPATVYGFAVGAFETTLQPSEH